MIAGTLSGVCEALTYAKAKGLDLQTVLDSVATGAAGSKQLDTFGLKILAGDYAPGFFLKHFVKDMKLALTEVEHEQSQSGRIKSGACQTTNSFRQKAAEISAPRH